MRREWRWPLILALTLAVVLGGTYTLMAEDERIEGAGRSIGYVAADGARLIAGLAKAAAVTTAHAGATCQQACGPLARFASSGRGCSVSNSASVPALIGQGGALTGNFHTAMSAVCQGACAIKVDFKPRDIAVQPGARAGQLIQCPVSGVVFRVQKGSASVMNAERTFYTCCGGCAARLQAEPERYLKS